jgi:hypothetical protein
LWRNRDCLRTLRVGRTGTTAARSSRSRLLLLLLQQLALRHGCRLSAWNLLQRLWLQPRV